MQPRQPFLELHRSVRFLRIRWYSLVLSFSLAGALSWLIAHYAAPLLQWHEDVRQSILEWSGVRIDGFTTTAVLGHAVRSSVTSVPGYQGRGWLLAQVACVTAALMLLVYTRSRLTRTLLGFGVSLLAASTIQAVLEPAPGVDSLFFVQFWLRCEFVVWLLLPWIMALLVALIMPSWRNQVLWITLAPAYGVLWSMARLTFCTGLLSFTGPVLAVLLWFSLGMLADVLALCVLYSFAVYQAGSLYRSMAS
jgi:hypothetical protein